MSQTFSNNVVLHAVTLSSNHADSDGGGLSGRFTVDQSSTISGNTSGGRGGGIAGVATITNSTLTGNSSATGGGGLYATASGTTIGGSRLYQNTSAQGGAGLDGDSIGGATIAATNNWWGSNNSPASFVNPSVVSYSPWLVMTFTASPTTVNAGSTSILTSSIATNSNNSSGLSAPDGTPVTFSAALGTVNPSSLFLVSAAATTTYTAGSTTGTAPVSATIDNQTLSANISIVLPPPPTVTSVSPGSGVQGTTVPVILTGTNFVSGATVATGNTGITVGAVTVVSATQITATFTIALNAAVGAANVTVTTSGGTSGAATFTVNPPTPTLSAVSPATGAQGATVPVTLTGTNFVTGASVTTSNTGITVSGVTVVSATQITATFTIATNAALGAANVTVTTTGGTSGAATFTVNPPAPTLTGVSPAAGVQGATVPVTLTGTNLVTGASVTTGNTGITVGAVTVVSATQITATFTIAANAALGAASVIATTSGGTSGAATFTVNSSVQTAPGVTSLSPTSGPVGLVVTIAGTNFGATQGASTVSFNGIPASPISWSAASIAVPVPYGATTGNVVVTVGGQASNSTAFTVTTPGSSTVAYVNSKNCATASTCTTSWNVTAGNILMVMYYDRNSDAGGNITDGQGNSYTSVKYVGNYDANLTLYGTTLASGGAPLTVSSSGGHTQMVLAEFQGVSLVIDGSVAQGSSSGTAVCPNGGPLTVTTSASDLLVSVLVEGTTAGSTTYSSGTQALGLGSGTAAFQFEYQIAPAAGTYTQQYLFSPGYNISNQSCVMVALRAKP